MNDASLKRSEIEMAPFAERNRAGSAEETNQLPVVSQYLKIALRWKWLILGAVAFALILGVLFTLLSTPQYTATTRLEINREGSRIVNVADVQPDTSDIDLEFYQTQYGLLMSRSLAQRVATQLRLADNPRFFELYGKTERVEELIANPPVGYGGPNEIRNRVAVDTLLENVDIAPMRLSRLVDIHVQSPDPELSARIANAWATGFIQFNLERRFEANSYARQFLEVRLAELRGRLETSERQLVGYASREALINVPVAGGPDQAGGRPQERSLTVETLAVLNQELARATADRVRAGSRVRGGQGGATSEALDNTAIASMRQRRAEAAAEYARLLTQFEPTYPPAQALAAQIQRLDQSIVREETRVQASLRNSFQDSTERERALSSRVEGLKQDFLDQRRRSIQYNILQREVDTNRELYNGLLQRYKEIGVAGGVGTNNISVVDQASVPNRPSHPRPLINLMIALLVGGVVGAGLALVREQMDETIADPSDLEKRIGVPMLGAVPTSESEDPLQELKDPKSGLIEAYLSLQTSLAFSTDHGIPRTLTVTSTRPSEGKSVTAFAIAQSLARTGAKTLLIDGDMRSPSVHGETGVTNDRGLSNYLSGTNRIEELIQRIDSEPFAILAAGPQPPNAAELLRSDRLKSLFDELVTMFDHVVVDSPPVMGLADAPIIASRTEATIFVIEARGVKARMARVALARLRQSRAVLLGAVLTKFDTRRANFGYGYDYGYGYGSAEAEKSARA